MRMRERGSTLLAVFWLIAILTFAIFAGMELMVDRAESQITRAQAFRAEQLLERGLAIAAHPGVQPGDPLLRYVSPDGKESMEATLESEGARFHLNALLQVGDRTQLEAIFTAWGLSATEIGPLIDRLQDWIDSDDLPRLNGMEPQDYEELGRPGLPFNRPFRSFEELRLVPGIDALPPGTPAWEDWFTLWSASGKLDINAAPADLIRVACNCPPGAAEAFVLNRNGPDGIPETRDDVVFPSVAEALAVLNVPGLDSSLVSSRLTARESVKRVAIVALVGDYGARRDVILNRDGSVQLHYWRDRSLP